MYHPQTMYDLAMARMADDIRQAERERLAKEAASNRTERSIDAVPFRERIARLFGTARPVTGTGLPAGA